MKRTLFIAMLLLLIASMAMADTWIARCKDIQINFDRTSKVFLLYMKTDAGIFQMARGKIVFDNGIAVGGPIDCNSVSFRGQPLTELRVNKDRGIIYVIYRHPQTGQLKSGTWGTTTVQIVP